MDNDLMARRLRPPSEPNRPNAPFIPPPTPAPWTPKPAPWQQTQTDAPLNQVPWDQPMTETPAADTSAQSASDDGAWPEIELTPPPSKDPVEAAGNGFDPEVMTESPTLAAAASTADADPEAYTAETEPEPVAMDEAPWDRPAPSVQQMDSQAGSASWDAPPPFVIDEQPFVDDRPSEMLDTYDEPVAVAASVVAAPAADFAQAESESPTVEAVAEPAATAEPAPAEAVAEAPATLETAAPDMSFDPYDADAPVVPEVARQALTPAWPSWNGHIGGGHELALPSAQPQAQMTAPDSFGGEAISVDAPSFGDQPAVEGSLEIEPETPAPWATDWPDVAAANDSPAAEPQQMETFATSEVDTEDVAQDDASDWAQAEGDQPAWMQADAPTHDDEVAEQPAADAPDWREPETPAWAQPQRPAWAQPEAPAWSEPAIPAWARQEAEQWMPPADAMPTPAENVAAAVDETASADSAMPESAMPESATPEENTSAAMPVTQVVATVPVDAVALANGPTTVIAGPDSGLPPNLVLRIELALVDQAAAPKVQEAESLPVFGDEGYEAAEGGEGEAWDEADEGEATATPAGFAADTAAAPEASAYPSPPSSETPSEVAPEWPTLVGYNADFEAPAQMADAPPSAFEPEASTADPWTRASAPAPTSSFEALSSAPMVPDPQVEPQPHVASVDDDDQWWVAPPANAAPTEYFEPAASQAPSHVQAPERPVNMPTAPTAPSVAWPTEATVDDVSDWPPVWDPAATGPRARALAAQRQPSVATGSSDWGWPAPMPLTQPEPVVDTVATDAFAPPAAWPASVRPLTPPPLGPATPAPRVSTIEAPQNDLWFLAAEPAPVAEEAAPAAAAEATPRSSLLTAGMTVGMAVVVVVLVLIFVQLMTSLLR